MSSFGPHLVAGVSVGLVSTGILGIHQYPDFSALTLLPFVGGVCGALTPDMDIKSRSSVLMYMLYAVGSVYLFFFAGEPFWGFLLLLYSVVPQFFSHRGFIHSGLFGLVSALGVFAALYCNSSDFGLCLAVSGGYCAGFLSHVLLDEV